VLGRRAKPAPAEGGLTCQAPPPPRDSPGMDSHQKTRPLTQRQTAVLAAVERFGEPTLPDLREEFPDLAPSEIYRVLESLERRGKIDWAGDDDARYLGGVRFWSTALRPTDVPEALEWLYEDLLSGSSGTQGFELDPYRRTITAHLPLADLAAYLRGEEVPHLEKLRRTLKLLQGAARFDDMRIWSQQREDLFGEPVLVLELRLPDHHVSDSP
jgi:hypothetical protein